MSDQQQDDGKFFSRMTSRFKAWIKNGILDGFVCNLSVHADTFCEWLQANKDEGGYCRFMVKTKKTPTEKNQLYIERDDWKPTPKDAPADDAPSPAKEKDDIPF